MSPPPIVTGLSPIEGPPGTRITIRGENFGAKPTDLTGLSICGYDCLLSAEWKSPTKIIARSGPGKGKGDVIVTTRQGGVGSCNVNFKGYHETIGPMKESAVWVEETVTFVFGRNALSPGSYQHEDPLGLSVEGNEKKFPEDDLLELFPNYSGDIVSDHFSASWFLLENHHCTSFNDLQAGLLHLRRKVDSQKEGQLSFLKANVGSVIDQLDTIVALKERYESDVGKCGTDHTLKLEKSISSILDRDARKLFDDILSRRDRAEKTRNALNVLARFRFLFCLPCVIERNIKKGDYDIVINDYIRVKNLFNRSEVPVFKTALNEIDKKISGLQQMLLAKLEKMPIAIEDQKRLIRYLVNLDANCEPAWAAITAHFNYIIAQYRQCYNEHKSLIVQEENARKEPVSSANKYSKFNLQADTLSAVPENVLFIEELCQTLSKVFPDLWKLGQSYFSGELHVKVESGRQVDFKHMVMTVMETFSKAVRATIIPQTLDKTGDRGGFGSWHLPDREILAPWFPSCLRYIRASYKILIKLDLPNEVLDIIAALILDLRIHSMGVLLKQATEHVSQLYKEEDWKIKHTGEFHGITDLPIKFERTIQDVIVLIKESVLTNELRENVLLDNVAAHKELDRQIEVLLIAFHQVLEKLAFRNHGEDEDDRSPVVSQLIGTPVSVYRSYESANQIPVWEYRILTTLANCQYTNGTVLNNICDAFARNNYNMTSACMQNVHSKLETLQKSILEVYLEQKSDPLVGTIEPSMYLGRFDWDTEAVPTDLRPYAKECINNLIHVHAEVFSISPSLVDVVLPQVVQTVAEELYRLMSCVQNFSEAGKQQAHLDITALHNFFNKYASAKAKMFFTEALEIIPALNDVQIRANNDILKQCQARMKLQLLCLHHTEPNPLLKV